MYQSEKLCWFAINTQKGGLKMKKILLIALVLALFIAGCFHEPKVKDCGTDDACFKEAMKSCTPAKALKKDPQSGTFEGMVKGYEGDKCVINMKIVDAKIPLLKDKEMTCKVPKADLDGFSAGGSEFGSSKMLEQCSGSLIDLLKSFGPAAQPK